MNEKPKFDAEEQKKVTESLREWIRLQTEHGVPMDAILHACEECGIVELLENMDDEGIPPVTD